MCTCVHRYSLGKAAVVRMYARTVTFKFFRNIRRYKKWQHSMQLWDLRSTKESYASNPDIDTSRSHLNFHLIEPQGRYRTEAEKQIAEAGCRTRKDSIRLVEVLFTASPEFFQGKKKKDVKEFFQEALSFLESRQNPNTIISAVVHMDEKTPHMHLSFVPLTEDGRLSAKDIVGNKKKLTQRQDEFWEHMVEKYPDLERGQSASETGRNHIPPRLFKQMTHLTKQKERIDALISDANFFNSKGKIDEVAKLLDKYIPAVAKMDTELKKYRVGYAQLERKNKSLEKQNERLTEQLEEEQHESILKKMEDIFRYSLESRQLPFLSVYYTH